MHGDSECVRFDASFSSFRTLENFQRFVMWSVACAASFLPSFLIVNKNFLVVNFLLDTVKYNNVLLVLLLIKQFYIG